jgi:hypothetical protein
VASAKLYKTMDLLAAKARARREEAGAARHEAEGYRQVAQACWERSVALNDAAAADEALVLEQGDTSLAEFARSDARRARTQARLFETQAHRYAQSAERALAEAGRADSEADTALAKAGREAHSVQ